MGSSLFALSYFISIFVRMKQLVVLLFLLGSIIPMTGQTIVELRKGATTVRSKNLHDYDVQTKDTRQEREDSLKYADNLKWAYNICIPIRSLPPNVSSANVCSFVRKRQATIILRAQFGTDCSRARTLSRSHRDFHRGASPQSVGSWRAHGQGYSLSAR